MAGPDGYIAGAEAVLRVRAIEICGDTHEYWRLTPVEARRGA